MQARLKIILLLALIVLIGIIFAFSSTLNSTIEDNTYLTPIPYETISAYIEEYPIDNKLEAVIIAQRYFLTGSRKEFTQGFPKVKSVERMKLSDAMKLLRDTDARPKNTEVWLVVFEGQWQILPPMSKDLMPLETGCIYIVFDTNRPGHGRLSARDCIPQE